jgi:hypothetical protein
MNKIQQVTLPFYCMQYHPVIPTALVYAPYLRDYAVVCSCAFCLRDYTIVLFLRLLPV